MTRTITVTQAIKLIHRVAELFEQSDCRWTIIQDDAEIVNHLTDRDLVLIATGMYLLGEVDHD